MIQCKICGNSSQKIYEGIYDDRYGYNANYDIYQCGKCQFGQLAPQLTPPEIDTLYTNFYPRKELTTQQVKAGAGYSNQFMFKIKSWLMGNNKQAYYGVPAQAKVLDVGCGSGSSLLDIQAQGAKAYGTEMDRNVESIAKKLNLQIHFGDIDSLPYEDEFFDYITMNQLIEHVIDPLAFIRQVSKKLKSGGSIIITTPNIDGKNALYSKQRWINWHVPYHLNFFSRHSWEYMAKQTNLTLQAMCTFTPMNWQTLQFLSNYGEYPKQGQPGRYWQPRPKGLTLLQYFKYLGWKDVTLRIMATVISYFTIPVWRWRDSRLQGDSFYIILRKQ